MSNKRAAIMPDTAHQSIHQLVDLGHLRVLRLQRLYKCQACRTKTVQGYSMIAWQI